MKHYLAALVLTSLTFSSFAQKLNTAQLDSLFNALASNQKYMGSFAIAQNGQNIYSRTIGKADIASHQDATTASKYRIGSISKTFTATLIFKAIEEKKLRLDQKIDTFFPTVKNADQITVAQLLSHRSGIHDLTANADYLQWNTQAKTRDELIKIISDGKIDFAPDSKASYSNSNYILLSFILENIYKQPLKNILLTKIVIPLKLRNTYLGSNITLQNNEVNSYSFDGSWQKETETAMSIPMGAGAIVSNPTDLNQFADALFNGKLISLNSLAQMKTIKDGYGMGLFAVPYDAKTGYGHTGGIDGFTSLLFYFPSDHLSIALTSNGNNYPNNDILIAGLNAYFGQPVQIPSFKQLVLKSEDLDQYLGEYSAPNFPLKINISKKDNVMITQATGQSAIAMEATGKDKFEFSQAGIILEFKPSEKQMILKQGGGKFILTKK